MSGTCAKCGGAVHSKNTMGHYRDKCCGCIIDAAAPTAGRPVSGCTCEKCEAART